MVAGGLPYADGFRRIGATLCWLGGFPTERILREMRHLRVSALLATTSFALHLAEQWDAVGSETGIASCLRKVIGGGEPGLAQPELRRRIAGGLALTHLRETMGLGDVIPSMWGECEAEDGMHFNAQRYVMVELIDPAPARHCRGARAAAASSSTRRSRATRRPSSATARATTPRWSRCAAPAAAPARASAASAAPTTC
jgi:phenylacetate-CoA ligase/benzoylacetate-CoA ligase